MADSACGLTIVKKFTYRGDANEEYSNTYWFTGTTPVDAAAWKTLADAVIAQEKTVYPSSVKAVRAYGYDSPNDTTGEHAVWSYDYEGAVETVAGTYSTTGLDIMAGDAATWIRWRTDRRTSPGGKLIYLRKYFHPAVRASGSIDSVATSWRSAAVTFGSYLVGATVPGSRKLCAMHHTEDAASFASDDVEAALYVTTRTLKRRGKRNPT